MGKGGFCEEFEESIALDVHLVGYFGMDFQYLFVEISPLFGFFLFQICLNSDRLSS